VGLNTLLCSRDISLRAQPSDTETDFHTHPAVTQSPTPT
jgi:hypothetical protein